MGALWKPSNLQRYVFSYPLFKFNIVDYVVMESSSAKYKSIEKLPRKLFGSGHKRLAGWTEFRTVAAQVFKN